jgi:hypothetical protein
MADEYRYLCDTSIRYQPEAPEVDALYRLEQERSRALANRGAGLSRADIEHCRDRRE